MNPVITGLENSRVYVAVPCGKHAECDSFYDCLYSLALPEGSQIQRLKSGSVSQNLNTAVELARGFDYICIFEDDSMFHPNTVLQLLLHQKDVVAGICPSRTPPFNAYIYDKGDSRGLLRRKIEDSDEGLIKVDAIGMGGILIKMSVFDKLKKPYFEIKFINEVEWGQDILFNKQLIAAGIEVYCDTDVPIWHATRCSLGTIKKNGKWLTTVRIGTFNIEIPIAELVSQFEMVEQENAYSI
jgi:hypothetical protein